MNIEIVHRFFEAYAAAWSGSAEDVARFYTVPVSLYAGGETRIWSTEGDGVTELREVLSRYVALGFTHARVVGSTGRALTPVLYQALVRYELLGDGGPLFTFDTQYLLREDPEGIGIVSVVVLDEPEKRHVLAAETGG